MLLKLLKQSNYNQAIILINDCSLNEINKCDYFKNTPLIIASKLIEKGTNVNSQNNYGFGLYACMKNNESIVIQPLDNGADFKLKDNNKIKYLI